MKLESLSEQNQKYYAAAKALYEEAFPVLERRDDLEQARIMKNPAYHFDFITDEDGFVGIMLYWETDSFVYLEHFCHFARTSLQRQSNRRPRHTRRAISKNRYS